MNASERISAKLDGIASALRDIRQYNRDTTLIAMVLPGIGLPLVLFISLIYAAHHF